METKRVLYDDKLYMVCGIKYKKHILPMILNYDDYRKINKLDKKWSCNSDCMVSCTTMVGDHPKEIFMHDIIMFIHDRAGFGKNPIIHLDKLGIDNRYDNLLYDTKYKDQNKNLKKKKRTVIFPKESGIDPNELPTYVWYVKKDLTHGDRFVVNIGGLSWKTRSSPILTLRYKLEEAKRFLRNLRRIHPELFEEYCMNGEFTKNGKDLLHSFYEIVRLAGYTEIPELTVDGETNDYLKEKLDELCTAEIELLKSQHFVEV